MKLGGDDCMGQSVDLHQSRQTCSDPTDATVSLQQERRGPVHTCLWQMLQHLHYDWLNGRHFD